MDQPAVSVLVATSNRPERLRTCVESILDQNHPDFELLILDSSEEIDSCDRIADLTENHRVTCTHKMDFRGVAGSRNWLIENARGDVLVFLDDDAYFPDKSALSSILDAFEDRIGIQAFRVVDNPGEQNEKIRVPLPKNAVDRTNLNTKFPVSYYIGAGHAIKRDVIETCGAYVDKFMYGSEELDLSYRAIDEGFNILYNPEVIVHHRPQQPVISTETTGHTETYYRVANRIFIAYKHLPVKYLPTYLFVWLLYFFTQSIQNNNIHEYVLGIRRGIKIARSTNRSPINSRTEQYLKRNYGRLWY
ncbi:glycosyltransferase family 2 protein [Halopenitus persicus]|uniref:glycosyltransferase family 2 protein n=1 Tax=Halopenitus persicus TaxID=1048396 RepID=UPI0012FDD6A6|nr:glycosyltransferase [Halopenitus persicus]